MDGAHDLSNPRERLTALSDIADKVQEEIYLHEEAITRLEDILSRIRRMGKEIVEEEGMGQLDGRIMLEILASERGGKLEDISEGVREHSSNVMNHLRRLKVKKLVEYDDGRWHLK